MKKFFNVFLCLFFIACSVNYNKYYEKINNYFNENKYDELFLYIDKNKKNIYSNKSLILYYLDKAFFMHISKNYLESNKYFTLAQKLYEKNYTESITRVSLSLFVNDKVLVYKGEDFEISVVFIFKALNYIMMDDLENALVEIRKGISFHKNLSNVLNSKKAFRENMFFDYISGILFEMNGDYNDAYISYKRALNLYNEVDLNYNFMQDLFNSTFYMAKKSMLEEKILDLKKQYPKFYKNYSEPEAGELIVISYIGQVPYRVSSNVEMSIFDAKQKFLLGLEHYKAVSDEDNKLKDVLKIFNSATSDYSISFSFPEYEKFFYKINSGKIFFKDKEYNLEKVLDIGDMVIKNFEYKKPEIYFKEISRAILKTSLVSTVNKKIQENTKNSSSASILEIGLKALTSVTEDADRRSWRILPDKIFMSRIPFVNKNNILLKIGYYKDKLLLKQFFINLENDINKEYIRFKKFIILRTIE